MKERPIPFSGPMVRALMRAENPKTQTRRLMRPQPPAEEGVIRHGEGWRYGGVDYDGDDVEVNPYGVPGDRLWVREAWQTVATLDRKSWAQIAADCLDAGWEKPWAPVRYVADGTTKNDDVVKEGTNSWGRVRVARFMPRALSRINLDVTAVRIQRVQEISEEDARAEGFAPGPMWGTVNGEPAEVHVFDPVYWYTMLWNQINGDREPWASNPFVWAITFRRVV